MAGKKDLKQGEKKTSSDDDRSEKKTSKDSSKKEDEKVTLPKSELQKLKEERENYKDGLLSTKQKLKEVKNQSSKENGLPDNDEDAKGEDLDSPMTKKEFYKAREKEAIQKATEDSKIDNNFDEIMEYYTPRRGKDTVENIVSDIKDAKYLWNKYKGGSSSEDKEASSKLSTESKKPSGRSSGQGKEKRQKRILPKNSSPEEWYGKKN